MTTYFVEMPLEAQENYQYSLSLEGVSYQFKFYWNSRSSQWHFDIRTETQADIVLGVPIVAQYPMLEDYNLEDVGLNGHFLLLPINVSLVEQMSSEAAVMPEFFKLFYVYTVED